MKKLIFALWYFLSAPVLTYFRNEYKRFKGRPAAMLRATNKALKLHKKTGKRYKVYFLNNKYQCLTRWDVHRRKHEKEFLQHINVTKLSAIAFFDTDTMRVADFAEKLLLTKYSLRALVKKGLVNPENK